MNYILSIHIRIHTGSWNIKAQVSSPDVVTALLVDAVVGQMHELVLDVSRGMVIFNCGKPTTHTSKKE